MEGGEVKVIPNQEGTNTTPSVVGFYAEFNRLVAEIGLGKDDNFFGLIHILTRFNW